MITDEPGPDDTAEGGRPLPANSAEGVDTLRIELDADYPRRPSGYPPADDPNPTASRIETRLPSATANRITEGGNDDGLRTAPSSGGTPRPDTGGIE